MGVNNTIGGAAGFKVGNGVVKVTVTGVVPVDIGVTPH